MIKDIFFKKLKPKFVFKVDGDNQIKSNEIKIFSYFKKKVK